jgi:hypothetical protein
MFARFCRAAIEKYEGLREKFPRSGHLDDGERHLVMLRKAYRHAAVAN